MRTSDQSYKKSEIGRISKKITLSSLSVLAIAMQPSWSTINLSMSGFLFLFFVLFFFFSFFNLSMSGFLMLRQNFCWKNIRMFSATCKCSP